MATILVVDDEPAIRSFLSGALATEGHDVDEAGNGREAMKKLAERSYHVLLTDLRMPEMDGIALLEWVRETSAEVEVVVLTAHGSVESAVHAMKLGAFDYLQKPIGSPAELRLVVAKAVERHRLRAAKEVTASADEPPLSYGAPSMEAVVRALRKVAATDATVLLVGESGTGKELAARAVHRWSARADGAFVPVNCAALSEQLLESELFGHERGAFTGAVARKRGRIELADGGTFFLDEVGELAPTLQAKLLRVVQERRFERVGGNQTVVSDVRWIAATNRDLSAMTRAGTFREDLYHRLAVFPVRLPALRERREDLPPLARALVLKIGAGLGRPHLTLTEPALALLARATWPGNVRQLANALERAAILADGDELGPEVLELFDEPTPTADAKVAPTTMADVERQAIERALAQFAGNRRQAAEHLGIGLRTLYEKLKRYGLG